MRLRVPLVGCHVRGPEGKTQDAVIKYAREKYNALCKKNEVGRYFVGSGFPDYTIFPDGKPAFMMEFKKPGGKLTPLQEEMRKQIEARGYKYYLVDDKEQGKKIIDKECA